VDVEIVGKFLSTLPEDDDHPYRTGPWRPQTTEWNADDLIAVDGEIPATWTVSIYATPKTRYIRR
jgi:carotenoid cleavage dioxygenase-like enzyme